MPRCICPGAHAWAPIPGAQDTSVLPSGTKSLTHVLSTLPVGPIQLLMARLCKHFPPLPSCQPHPRPGMTPVAQGPGDDLREAQLQCQMSRSPQWTMNGLGGAALRPLSPSQKDPETGDSIGYQICIFFFYNKRKCR